MKFSRSRSPGKGQDRMVRLRVGPAGGQRPVIQAVRPGRAVPGLTQLRAQVLHPLAAFGDGQAAARHTGASRALQKLSCCATTLPSSSVLRHSSRGLRRVVFRMVAPPGQAGSA